MPQRISPGGSGRTRIGGWHRHIRIMRVAGDGEGGGQRRDSRRGGHCRVMADTATVGILRERKGGEDELTQKRGRSSRKGPDARHSQVVGKGGWGRAGNGTRPIKAPVTRIAIFLPEFFYLEN